MSVLRIALVSPFPPLKGGIARFSGELQEALLRCGCTVRSVGFRSLYPSFLLAEPTEISAPPAATPASLVLYNPLTWRRASAELRDFRPDVVLLAHWAAYLLPLWLFLRRASDAPTLLLLHNLSSHDPLPMESLLLRLLPAAADGAVALSSPVADAAAALMPGKPLLQLAHPPYAPAAPLPSRSTARREAALPDTGPLLLFFGYVRPYKGLDLLLEAMPAILASNPAVRLVVAGEFLEPLERYHALALRLGVADRVEFRPGYRPSGEASLLFAAADLLVLPYRRATQSGVAGMAFGHNLPVVATPAGALAEGLRSDLRNRLASEATPQALAEAVGSALAACGLGAPEEDRASIARREWDAAAGSLLEFCRQWRCR